MSNTKKEICQKLSVITNTPPSRYMSWSLLELRQRFEAIQEEDWSIQEDWNKEWLEDEIKAKVWR